MPAGKPHARQRFARARERIGPAQEFERQGHILNRGHGWNEVEGLEHDAGFAAPDGGKPVFAGLREIVARDEHLS